MRLLMEDCSLLVLLRRALSRYVLEFSAGYGCAAGESSTAHALVRGDNPSRGGSRYHMVPWGLGRRVQAHLRRRASSNGYHYHNRHRV